MSRQVQKTVDASFYPFKTSFFHIKIATTLGYGGLHGIGIGHPQPAHELGLDAHL